jgi:hypothetical protein
MLRTEAQRDARDDRILLPFAGRQALSDQGAELVVRSARVCRLVITVRP